MSNVRALWELVAASGDGRYAPKAVREQLLVTGTVSDSNGATTQARGTIDGGGDFTVDVRGKGVRTGMLIGVTRPVGDPTAPLAFDGIDGSDDPTAGYTDSAQLPTPAYDSPPYTTSVVASPGSVASRITVHFLAVPDKYAPSRYLVSWRYPSVTGDWKDEPVPHLGGAQLCGIPPVFPPGASVDIKLRARYDWAHSDSVQSAVVTATVAADTGTPGVASSVAVANTTPGQLVATVTSSTIDQNLWLAWRYEFSTSATGPATATVQTPGPGIYTGAPGNYWCRVAPVSKSGTVGTFTGWTGPTGLASPAILDTTPPAAWTAAPTLADSSYISGEGTWHGNVRVGLPTGHVFEPDYAYTLIRVQNLANGLTAWYRLEGTSLGPMEVAVATAGQTGSMAIVADAVGVDLSGNRLGTYSPQATVTITAPGLPVGTLTVTVAQRALGLLVSWAGVTGATWYDVYRSTVNTGAGAVLVAGRVTGGGWFDPLADQTVILPTYYYQARSFNAQGAGPVSQSPWPGAATLPADAGNLRQNSITAAQVAADTAIFNKIVALDTIVANSILTSDLSTATSTIRISGPNGNDPNTITFWEKISGAWLRRVQMRGTGMFIYNDDQTIAASFARDANGRAALSLNGITLYNAAAGLGVSEIRLDKAVARFIGPGYAGTSYWDYRSAIAGGPPALGAGNCLALTPTIGTTDTFAIGTLNSDGSGKLLDGIIVQPRSGGGTYIGFLPGGSAQPFADLLLHRSGAFGAHNQSLSVMTTESAITGLISGDHVVHRNNDTGVVYFGNSIGHYLLFDGTTFVFSNNGQMPILTATNYISAANYLYLGSGAMWLGFMNAATPYGSGLTIGRAATGFGYNIKAGDIYAVRDELGTPANGVIFLGNQPGAPHYVFYNGSQYVMPSVSALINGVTVGSSREVKRDIDNVRSMRHLVRGLRARKFKRKEHGDDAREELGFIAEEVAELLPEVVSDIDIAEATLRDDEGNTVLDEHGHTQRPPAKPSLGIDYFPLVAAFVQAAQEEFTAQEARLDDLTARLARLEGATA